MPTERLLVPLSRSVTVRQTVGHVVQATDAELHFVVAVSYDAELPEGTEEIDAARELLDRAVAWAHEDADGDSLSIETAVLGRDEYLFGPRDFADVFAAYCKEHEIDRLVLDPEYQPGASAPMIQPLERALTRAGLAWEEAPVQRPAHHERLVGRGGRNRFLALFGVSYVFYLLLGDPTYWFDLLTGLVVGVLVAITLSHVTFTTAPTLRRSPIRNVRFALFIPYLLFEIIKANIAISIVILRPSMPIDPRLTRIVTRVGSGLPVLALANSITLTPGTLTVRANDQRLIVHTLIPSAREDLFDGRLERAVRFVFYGRAAMMTPTIRERGDAEVIGGDEL